MSEESKKVERIEPEAKKSELSEQELDTVAGGGANQPISGVGIGLGKHTHTKSCACGGGCANSAT
jgi:hypothetical protein